MRYLDFDLVIHRRENGFRSQVLKSPAGDASCSFDPIFTETELENYLLKMGHSRRSARGVGSPEYLAAKTLGDRQFSLVFNEEVRSCLRRSIDLALQQQAGLRVRLRLSEVPELTDLPWEYLYDRAFDRFLTLSQSLRSCGIWISASPFNRWQSTYRCAF